MDEAEIKTKQNPRPLMADKATLRQILEVQDERNGFALDPNATPQKARELMPAQGIRPEDNTFSREIRRTRR